MEYQSRLEFPVLVEQDSTGYKLQPLLFPGPYAQSQRYNNSVNRLQTIIRKHYRECEIDRSEMEALLWFQFCPDLQFYQEFISFRSGMHLIEGNVAIASYSIGQHRYLCLPKLSHLTLRIPQEIRGKSAVSHHLIEQLIAFFKKERKEKGSEFSSAHYFSNQNTHTSYLSFSIEYRQKGFQFEQEDFSFYSLFGGQATFKGYQEIDKVAYAVDAEAIDPCLFREKETACLEKSLFGPNPCALSIVGYSGIGKTNLVNHAYGCFLSDKNKRSSKLPKLWRLDPLKVISGMSIVGQWERRFETILRYVRDRIREHSSKTKATDILVIDNPVALMRIGKSSQTELTLAHLLIPYIERREFPVVIEATPQEWQKMQDINRRFTDLFQVQRIQALSQDKLNDVILHGRADIEYHYQCEFSLSALSALLKAERQLHGSKILPGSLIDMMKTIAVTCPGKKIDDQLIYQSLQESYHIHRRIMDQSITLTEAQVSEHFSTRLIGQEEACQALIDTVLSIKANIQAGNKPLNTLLFIGPTGVGKTEAAKLLASYLFASEDCFIRVDMNEYVDEYAIDRLIGGGRHGHGLLTERVRHQKTGVLLLDEIEKAHPNIHDLLLQLLDDGRLTDANGQTTDFTQTVIIMTSNTGAREANAQVGFIDHAHSQRATYIKSVEQNFRPELVNRINQIVVFESLKLEHMQSLALLHLQKILQRDGFTRRSTILNVAPECLSHMANMGYDPTLGARALKRNLERLIAHSSAAKLTQTQPDSPVILNMGLSDGKLVSTITELTFADAYPHSLPSIITYSHAQYVELYHKLEAVEQQLSQTEGDALRWTLTDTLRDLKEPLGRFIGELEEQSVNTSSFTYKPSVPKYLHRFKSPRINFAALHAEQDIALFLEDQYQQAESFFATDKTNQYELWSQSRRVLHGAESYCQHGTDSIYLQITPLLLTKASDMLDTLSALYKYLVNDLGHVEIIDEHNNKQRLLHCHGPGIKEWLHHEAGIHLFHRSGQHSLPVLVTVNEQPAAAVIDNHQIVRVYTQTASAKSVTDIRTGLMIDSELGPHWWTLVLAYKGSCE